MSNPDTIDRWFEIHHVSLGFAHCKHMIPSFGRMRAMNEADIASVDMWGQLLYKVLILKLRPSTARGG